MGLSYEIHYKIEVENVVVDALSRAYTEVECNTLSQVQPKWMEEILSSYKGNQKIAQLLVQTYVDPTVMNNITIHNLLRFKGKIWVGNGNGLRQQLVQQAHDSSLGGALTCFNFSSKDETYFLLAFYDKGCVEGRIRM